MSAFRSRQHSPDSGYDLLPPERPAAVGASRRPLPRAADVIDAEFVVVRDTRPRHAGTFVYNDNRKPPVPVSATAPTRLKGALRSIEGWERALRRIPENAFSMMVAAAAVGTFALFGGLSAVAGLSAPAAALVQPIDITHVSLTPRDANGMHLLVVHGTLENNSGKTVALPRIRADLIAGGRQVASALIDAPADTLEAGRSRGFSAKLAYPGGKMPEVRLSLAWPNVAAR